MSRAAELQLPLNDIHDGHRGEVDSNLAERRQPQAKRLAQQHPQREPVRKDRHDLTLVLPFELRERGEPRRAEGRKCARSWRFTTDVGADPAYPDLSARDAAAMREIEGRA